MGYGDVVVFQMFEGFILFVDIGGDFKGCFDVGWCIVVLVLYVLGVSKVDVVLFIYLYFDYVGGLRVVIDEFEVGELWINGCILNVLGMGDFFNFCYCDLICVLSCY